MSDHNAMNGGIAGRYASALFDLADQAGSLDVVETDLNALGRLIQSSDDLRHLIQNPLFTRDEQSRALDAVMAKGSAHKLTRNFIGLVAKNRRLFALNDMIRAFAALMAERRGEVTAKVTTARPLSDTQRDELKAALKKSLGRDVTLDHSVDASLMGGLIVKVGSRMVDSSIRTKLNNLKIAMKEAG